MAYLNYTASGYNDALDNFQQWAVTNGWTSNSFIDDASYYEGSAFTGKRSHLQKTGGAKSLTAYVNMRSATSQRVFSEDFSLNRQYITSGIAVNLSTGYNSGNTWDMQPGYSQFSGETFSVGTMAGAANLPLETTSMDCHFFASNSGDTITGMFQSDDESDIYFGICFGFSSKGDYFCAGSQGGYSVSADNAYGLFNSGAGVNGGWFCDGTNQRRWGGEYGTWDSYSGLSCYNRPSVTATANNVSEDYLVRYSVDGFLGNTALVPSMVHTDDAISSRNIVPLGEIPGVKFVNMTNFSTLEDKTVGTDTYKLFRAKNGSGNIFGVAIEK